VRWPCIAVGQSPLPTLNTNAAIINGYSQPGSSQNTLAHGDDAKLTIALDGGMKGFDGLTLGQPGSQVSGLDIEQFQKGVVITAGGDVQVAGCFIGTDPTGENDASNGNGVVIDNSSNLIGGPNIADRNVISGNIGNVGIYVPDQTTNPLGITPTGNAIENNFIGLDAPGTRRLGKAYAGVSDQGTGDTYGGATAGLGNLVSGNGDLGIASTGSITIEGNYIGTNATGNVALENGPSTSGGTGIVNGQQLHATSVTTVISDNVVSGNNTGISVFTAPGSHTAYTITNNLIRTNAAGTSALGNIGTGLELDSVENATVQNNVISANYQGVVLQTVTTLTELQHDVFPGNLIGTDKTGTVALGNKSTGISIDPGSGITIGGTGPGEGNVIAYNLLGIDLSRGQQDQFIRNSIFGNTGVNNIPPGIIVDSGANQSVTAPVLTFTPGTGSTGTLSGSLTAAPNATYVVEVFSNPSAHAPGQEQGETFVQDITVKTDSTGNGTFSMTQPNGFYTATTTDSSGNTSAFSNSVGLVTLPATTTTVSSSQNPSTVGQQVTLTAVVTAASFQGTPTGTVTFSIDGHAQPPTPLSIVDGKDEAQFVTSTLTAGLHAITATYGGDTHVARSDSSMLTQTVTAPTSQPTVTTLTSSLDPSAVGQSLTFTAVVSPGASAGVPMGTVSFMIDGTPQTPVPLMVINGHDQAVFAISTLSAGTHTISANYSGDMTFAASSVATPLLETVNAAPLTGTADRRSSARSPTNRFRVDVSPSDRIDPMKSAPIMSTTALSSAGNAATILCC
jgi:hypothetical protein